MNSSTFPGVGRYAAVCSSSPVQVVSVWSSEGSRTSAESSWPTIAAKNAALILTAPGCGASSNPVSTIADAVAPAKETVTTGLLGMGTPASAGAKSSLGLSVATLCAKKPAVDIATNPAPVSSASAQNAAFAM